MKKIVDDERLIYKVCCLYYQDNMNQKEIGDYLGVSRSSVLRMLQKGKELGIVKIKLNNPSTFDYGEMEKKLENMYGLKDVLIVENSVQPPTCSVRLLIISTISSKRATRSASLWGRH